MRSRSVGVVEQRWRSPTAKACGLAIGDEDARLAVLDDLGQATDRAGHHRGPQRLGLERDQPERLGARRHHADVGERVVVGEVLVLDGAEEAHPRAPARVSPATASSRRRSPPAAAPSPLSSPITRVTTSSKRASSPSLATAPSRVSAPLSGSSRPAKSSTRWPSEPELGAQRRGVARVQHAQVDARAGRRRCGCARRRTGASGPWPRRRCRSPAGRLPATSSPRPPRARSSSGRPDPRLGARQGVEGLHPGDVPGLAQLLGPPGRRASSGRGPRCSCVARSRRAR